MHVTITTRNEAVSNNVRRHMEERLARVQRFEQRPTTATVCFGSARGQKNVEIKLNVAGGPSPLLANGGGASFRSALDAAVDKLLRQLKRERERHREHQAPRIA